MVPHLRAEGAGFVVSPGAGAAYAAALDGQIADATGSRRLLTRSPIKLRQHPDNAGAAACGNAS